jgi:hypothetical protein
MRLLGTSPVNWIKSFHHAARHLIDSVDQGFDPNAHLGGILSDSAEDLGYPQGGEMI